MSTRRLGKVNELIRQELGKILFREIEFPQGFLVTISKVITSVDLSQAKISVSVLPDQFRASALKILNKKVGYCQKLLNNKLVMQHVPKIKFEIDTTEGLADEINQILDEIEKSN